VDEVDAVGHRPLEGLAPDDEPGPAGPLVDDGGADGLGQVAAARDSPPELMSPMRPA
jgi:hypothetical protein